jgi:hypothetical protein
MVTVVFLIRRDSTDASAAWWHQLRLYDSAAPAIVREPLRGPSVVADVIEVRQAVACARAHPSWRDDDPPLLAQDKATAAGSAMRSARERVACRTLSRPPGCGCGGPIPRFPLDTRVIDRRGR